MDAALIACGDSVCKLASHLFNLLLQNFLKSSLTVPIPSVAQEEFRPKDLEEPLWVEAKDVPHFRITLTPDGESSRVHLAGHNEKGVD